VSHSSSINSISNSPVGGTCNVEIHNDPHSQSFTSSVDGYSGELLRTGVTPVVELRE
jgi:hypothetical protein